MPRTFQASDLWGAFRSSSATSWTIPNDGWDAKGGASWGVVLPRCEPGDHSDGAMFVADDEQHRVQLNDEPRT